MKSGQNSSIGRKRSPTVNLSNTMIIEPIEGTPAATVTDVDLARLNENSWQEIYQAFLQYGVLLFPAQHELDDVGQSNFARRFGNFEKTSPKQDGGTVAIANTKSNGSVAKPGEYQYELLRGNEGWHTDSTYMPLASKAAMLYAQVVPPEGGETGFADMRAAWDELDAETQGKLEDLSAYHSLYYSQRNAGYQFSTDNLYGFHDKGAPLRPLIKTHPETGRKSIYTGRHAYGIVGMDPDESEQLLTKLMDDACRPPRTYIHKWQPGDLVVWDNRCMMHCARPYDTQYPRVLRGSRIAGDEATELAPTFPDKRATAFNPTTSNQSSLS
ncbi:MAG TPA: TauD/TfdA family dioxygenase [Gammaproteobacteria bacterium]|nr:TauD/TfdA family dioxygenase [Gammaproteobacteria bacterium]